MKKLLFFLMFGTATGKLSLFKLHKNSSKFNKVETVSLLPVSFDREDFFVRAM